MQAVLVAGGAGFIGSNLCQSLISDNFLVFCVDNLLTSEKKNLEGFLKNPNFIFLEKDITKPLADIEDKISKVSYIFHMASPASPNIKNAVSYMNHPVETLLANSVGTYNLLELARKLSAKFLFASSSEVYGDPTVSPQKEDYFGNVNPNGTRSVYDEGKRFGESITMSYFRKFGIDTKIARIFNTYGPNLRKDDGRVVSNFITQTLSNEPITIYGDGSQTRSLVYIDDMVEGLKKLMFNETRGEVFNLGNPQEITVLSLAKKIKEMTNSKSDIVFEALPEDDPKRRLPDISKAIRILDWKPQVSVDDGLNKTIEYFKSI